MGFRNVPLKFEPGIFVNRTKRASKQRWVDGNLVRFRDGPPEQVGGWLASPFTGVTVDGLVRAMIAWRPNSGLGRYLGMGSHQGFFLISNNKAYDLTPVGFEEGRSSSLFGAGYGAGSYGVDLYGTPRDAGGKLLDASVWTMDMFGEIMLACFNSDGKIYDFSTTDGDTKLQEIPGITGRAICVSDERNLFVFGANGNPGSVKWSDREDYTEFTASATNRAGGYQMQIASAFQCGRRVRGMVIGWTQTEVFGFRPLNNALVYDRERLATGAGACGPQSVAVVTDSESEVAYWMGPENFFLFDGEVKKINCELWDYIYKDINLVQRAKFIAGVNAEFNEIWFFYCSANSTENNRGVILNYVSGAWSKAQIGRTAWLDKGIYDRPLGFEATGTLYEHENGETNNGVAMNSFISSHPIVIGEGEQTAQVDGFWPDMEEDSAECRVSFITRAFAGDNDFIFGPYEFEWTDEKIDLAIDVRQLQVRIQGGFGYWAMGQPMISVQGGGLK